MVTGLINDGTLPLKDRLRLFEEELQSACLHAGRKREEVQVVAVTKLHPLEEVLPLLEEAYTDWGENRVQDLLRKKRELHEISPSQEVRWHLIGSLQKNKVKQIAQQVVLIHSVDSLSLLETLHREGERSGRRIPCLLQFNLSREESKHGFLEENLHAVLEQVPLSTGVQIQGLMTMAPRGADEIPCRRIFEALRKLLEASQSYLGREELEKHPFEKLSMGMSDDFPWAIQEGATHIRVGRKILPRD